MHLKDLLSFDDIVIQCHDFPDADTIASGYAVYRYLVSNGKKPRLVYSGKTEISKPNLLLFIFGLEFQNIFAVDGNIIKIIDVNDF